jgi:hypothetical protein
LKSDQILVVQKLIQNSWLIRSCFSEQIGYKICMIWIWESAVLNHKKKKAGAKTDKQQFCKKLFSNPVPARI